jgi:hypothetical protein
MPIRKKLSDDRSREFWRLAQEASRAVADWPSWKRESVDKEMSRGEFVRQIQQGDYPNYHVRIINGVPTPVSNPDGSDEQ